MGTGGDAGSTLAAQAVHRIGMVVLGGFLGAGKTTLLNAFLALDGLPRLCVLVNDFGALQVDASLVRARSDEIIELDNGCICCSLGEGLMQRLVEISGRHPAPELLVIEASGVSDPLRIAQIGLLDRAFSLNAVAVAVDAEHFEQQLADARIVQMLRTQVAGASVIALTRLDLAAPARVARLRAILQELNPRAPVLEAPRGELARLVFLDPTLQQGPGQAARVPLLSGDGSWRRAEVAHAELGSCVVPAERPFERQALKQALRGLPWKILRAKGFVRLAERPGWWLLQMACGRIAFSPVDHPPGAGIVLVGCFTAADHAALVRSLQDACAPVPPAQCD